MFNIYPYGKVLIRQAFPFCRYRTELRDEDALENGRIFVELSTSLAGPN